MYSNKGEKDVPILHILIIINIRVVKKNAIMDNVSVNKLFQFILLRTRNYFPDLIC